MATYGGWFTLTLGALTVKKVVWLAIQSASQKWTMPLKDWRMAMSRFIIEFGDRLDGHF
ncbi:TPA: transposase, partial [Escherichia coli]|nr:transposase [Escherichia coli]